LSGGDTVLIDIRGLLRLERWRRRFEDILTSFWFVPLVIGAGGWAVALVALELDQWEALRGLLGHTFFRRIEPDTARSILGTIAAATISATSIVYSLSLLIRNLAASTLGPRLVQDFRQDRLTRLALGMQLATFTYALTTLYYLGTFNETRTISIGVAIGFVLVALSFLVVFVNHISDQVSVDHIVARVAGNLQDVLRSDVKKAEESREPRLPVLSAPDGATIFAEEDGYVTFISYSAIANGADPAVRTVELLVRPGDFVIKRKPVARIDLDEPPEDFAGLVRDAIILGAARTYYQDIQARFQLLVEIALRALSPGVNDVFTAVACANHIGAAFALLDGRDLTPPVHFDEKRDIVVVPKVLHFDDIASAVFHPLRQAGADVHTMNITLLTVLGDLITASRSEKARAIYLEHARLVVASARRRPLEAADEEIIDKLFERARGGMAAAGDLEEEMDAAEDDAAEEEGEEKSGRNKPA